MRLFHFTTVVILIVEAYAFAQVREKNIIDLRGVRIFRKERKIEVKGKINLRKGLIELLATAPGGKEHERLLVVNCNPSHLKTALYIIGLNHGGGPKYQGDPTRPYGDPVYI